MILFCPPPSLALTPSFLLQSVNSFPRVDCFNILVANHLRSARTVKKRGACLCSFFFTFLSHLQIFGLIKCARIDWTLRISHPCVHYLCLPERPAMGDGFSANSILSNVATAVETARQWLGSSVWNHVNLTVVVLSRRAGVRGKDKPESQDRRLTR
jgi:hypothetical protein